MSLVRAQTTFQYFTGLPEDVSTNVSYWDIPLTGLTDPIASEIIIRLSNCYNTFSAYLSPVINPRAATVKLYDMGDAEPRIPYKPGWGFGLGAANPAFGLANEVCCVVSFHSAAPLAVPTARQRGRFYIGPLIRDCIQPATDANYAYFTTGWTTALRDGIKKLQEPVDESAGVVWAQRSATSGAFATVTGAWIDNEADTQRRRGTRATARTSFDVG